MRILLVRHGESLGNVDPLVHATTADHAVPLSDLPRGHVARVRHDVCHLSPEWFEVEANPHNCAIRLIDGGTDKGYVFGGFPRDGHA